jgi:hypothetical protein
MTMCKLDPRVTKRKENNKLRVGQHYKTQRKIFLQILNNARLYDQALEFPSEPLLSDTTWGKIQRPAITELQNQCHHQPRLCKNSSHW